MRTLLPWLPAFLFGGILILVGKILQSVEKKKKLERRPSIQPLEIDSAYSAYTVHYNLQDPALPIKELGPYPGKPQKKQDEGFYKN